MQRLEGLCGHNVCQLYGEFVLSVVGLTVSQHERTLGGLDPEQSLDPSS